MERVTKIKFMLVLFIGFVLVGFIIMSFFSGKKEVNDFESFVDSDYSEIENPLEDVEQEGSNNFETKDSISEKIEISSDGHEVAPNYMDVYMDKFGVLASEEAMEDAKKIVTLFLEENSDKTMWESFTTPSFLNSFFQDFNPSSDDLVRIIYQLEVHAAEPMNENEMRFGVFAQWNLSDGEHTISQQNKFYYVTFELFDTSWLVKELVEL